MLTLAAAYLLRAAGGSIGGMLPLAFGVILVALAIAFALLDLPQWMRDLSPYARAATGR